MTDEDDFEGVADEIDSPKITPDTLSIFADFDFPTPTQQLADDIARLTEPFEQFQEFQKARAADIIEPFEQFQQARVAAIAEPFEELSRMRTEAIIDLPDEVFSTAIAASTVSARASTTSSPTPSPSSTESVEAPANPSYDDIDVEAPKSLYFNSAYTLAQYIAYRIDGLSQQQRAGAIMLIGAGIAAGAAHHPKVSETPLVASTSVITYGMLLQLLWGVGEQE